MYTKILFRFLNINADRFLFSNRKWQTEYFKMFKSLTAHHTRGTEDFRISHLFFLALKLLSNGGHY